MIDEDMAPQGTRTDPSKDDPLAAAILLLLAERPPGKSITPEEVARAFAAARATPGGPPDLWRRYLQGVREQALHLARAGRLVILRKGQPADPSRRVKGVIRLALPGRET
ncbi:MAG: DUF3253 domain-containing protein [Kiloniellales bacterium]|nr:DUF3253 domain-containing protein [Kiloniellales bacterium]